MNTEEFVKIIKQVVENSSVVNTQNTLITISKYPNENEISEWYMGLDEKTKRYIFEIISMASSSSVFGFFCVLDGVRAIENGPDKGSLELFYVNGKTKVLINDFEKDFLHDIYKSMD